MALLDPEALCNDSHISPEFEKFSWPVVGSLACMRQWNFEQGITSLQARAYRYGYEPEVAPLSPKSRLVHIALEEPMASPTTVLSRKPIYDDDAEPQYIDNYSDDPVLGMLHPFDVFRLLKSF